MQHQLDKCTIVGTLSSTPLHLSSQGQPCPQGTWSEQGGRSQNVRVKQLVTEQYRLLVNARVRALHFWACFWVFLTLSGPCF